LIGNENVTTAAKTNIPTLRPTASRVPRMLGIFVAIPARKSTDANRTAVST